jgi:hypothetical protein
MRQFRPLLVFSAALIALFALAGIVSAGVVGTTYTVTITDASCEEISFEYVLNSESSNGADFAEFEVIVDGSPVVSGTRNPYLDSATIGLNLTPRAAPYFIEVIVYIPQYATGSAAVQVVCGEEPGEVATGQICFGRGAVAATVFIRGDSIDIYAIDPLDNGELVMSFTQEYLRTIPAGDEARLLGDSDRHIPIEFYRNANRLYRMVAGPDAEGKFFECTFGGACSHERTWIGEANRPTDEVVPVCAPVIEPTLVPLPTLTPLPTR